jgi:hypothetical protein
MAAGYAPSALAAPAQAGARDPLHIWNVRDFGATGNGKTLDTKSINAAIDACNTARGGVVYLPPGTYLSGMVVIKSNVTLYLEAGATLLGSRNIEDYAKAAGHPDTGDTNQRHLIFARDAENIGLAGPGRIDGQGPAFWIPSGRKRPASEDDWKFVTDSAHNDWKVIVNADGRQQRPSPLIEIVGCKYVRIEDVRIENSPGWTLRPINCDNVLIRGISIKTAVYGPNADGIDPTGCRNVMIAGCSIDTCDDNICLKSENPYGGEVRVSKNITITNCILSGGCNGLKVGTATRGAFENVTFSNSVIFNEDVSIRERLITGIAIEMVDGGSLEGLVISNVRMQRARAPILIRRGIRRAGPDGKPGTLRGVMIDNLHATGAILSSFVGGLPGFDVEDVTLSNIRIDSEEAGKEEWVTREIPEDPKGYPQVREFGRLPSYGFYCRHVNGLNLRGIELRAVASEARPALVCDDVKNLDIDGFRSSAVASGQPAVRLIQTRSAFLRGCHAPAGAKSFLDVQGPQTERITLLASDLGGIEKPVQVGSSVPPGAVSAPGVEKAVPK